MAGGGGIPPPMAGGGGGGAGFGQGGPGGGWQHFPKLRPCPTWVGGPDKTGIVPSGSEPWREYASRLTKWIMTGQRMGVPNGILASELSEALPEGPKGLLKNIPGNVILEDGRPPGMWGPQDIGVRSGLQIIFDRLNRQYQAGSWRDDGEVPERLPHFL